VASGGRLDWNGLRDGARVEDWRRIGQDDDGGRVTALHYAVRAGCKPVASQGGVEYP